jgi:hypothetical protein
MMKASLSYQIQQWEKTGVFNHTDLRLNRFSNPSTPSPAPYRFSNPSTPYRFSNPSTPYRFSNPSTPSPAPNSESSYASERLKVR